MDLIDSKNKDATSTNKEKMSLLQSNNLLNKILT